MRTFVNKGIKDPAEKLEELKVLDVVALLDPLEAQTRNVQDDPDMLAFRAALGMVYAGYGDALIELEEDVSSFISYIHRGDGADIPGGSSRTCPSGSGGAA